MWTTLPRRLQRVLNTKFHICEIFILFVKAEKRPFDRQQYWEYKHASIQTKTLKKKHITTVTAVMKYINLYGCDNVKSV